MAPRPVSSPPSLSRDCTTKLLCNIYQRFIWNIWTAYSYEVISIMALPQSFSTTADCPFMEHSSSTATVKLSSSSNPTSPLLSRSIAFSAGIEGQTRARSQTESGQNMNLPSSPTMRSRLSPIRMTQSGSFASLLMSVRSRSRSKAGDIDRLSSVSDVQTVEPPTSWFGKACNLIRPWEDNEDEDIPEEQKQAYIQTREVRLFCRFLSISDRPPTMVIGRECDYETHGWVCR